MPNPTQFLNGVSSVNYDSALASLPYIDPRLWCVHFVDMTVIPTSLGWTNTNTNGALTIVSTGGCGASTQACAGADNDLSQLYMTAAPFTLTAGKKAIFSARVQVTKEATATIGEQELFVGLAGLQQGTDFTAADGLTMTADNAVGFFSPDGTTNISCISRATDVESIQTAAGTYAAATWYVLSIKFDGTSLYFHKDGVNIATLATYPTAALSPTLYIKAGEAKISSLLCDYVLVAVER